VPYTPLSTDDASVLGFLDEVMGIINFLRVSNAKSLNIIEQARLIDDLHKVHKMSVLSDSPKLREE